jgi:hypothetical protein
MQIEEFRARLEEFDEALNREQYLHYSGLKASLETIRFYDEYSTLFSLETIRELQSQLEPASVFESRKKSISKLLFFSAEQYLEKSCASLTEAIANFESNHTVSWNGADIFFNQIPARLANEPDAGRRRRLDELQARALADSNGLRQERMTMLHREARTLGHTNYLEAFEAMRGIGYRDLAASLEKLLLATEMEYMDGLNGSAMQRLGFPRGEMRRCDVGYWRRTGDFGSFFRKERLIPILSRTFLGLGIDLEKQPGLTLDLEDRPHKHPRAFCAPVRVPQEIKIVLLPRGGPDDYSALLHESGHAQHFLWTSPTVQTEHRLLGDRALSESFAFLCEHLIWSESWLRDLVGIANAREFLRFQALQRAHLIRRYCGKLSYEIEFHGNGIGAGLDELYTATLRRATGIDHSEESYLQDVEDGFYAADYLRAWIFEAQLRDYLRTQFGNSWFANRKAGMFLKEIWETGQLYAAEELAKEIGVGPLDSQVLTDELLLGLRQ